MRYELQIIKGYSLTVFKRLVKTRLIAWGKKEYIKRQTSEPEIIGVQQHTCKMASVKRLTPNYLFDSRMISFFYFPNIAQEAILHRGKDTLPLLLVAQTILRCLAYTHTEADYECSVK